MVVATAAPNSSTVSPYECPMDCRNRNANASRLDPSRSPNAVRYGMAELSGSIFHFHMAWMMIWAMYRSNITCIKLTSMYDNTNGAPMVDSDMWM